MTTRPRMLAERAAGDNDTLITALGWTRQQYVDAIHRRIDPTDAAAFIRRREAAAAVKNTTARVRDLVAKSSIGVAIRTRITTPKAPKPPRPPTPTLRVVPEPPTRVEGGTKVCRTCWTVHTGGCRG